MVEPLPWYRNREEQQKLAVTVTLALIALASGASLVLWPTAAARTTFVLSAPGAIAAILWLTLHIRKRRPWLLSIMTFLLLFLAAGVWQYWPVIRPPSMAAFPVTLPNGQIITTRMPATNSSLPFFQSKLVYAVENKSGQDLDTMSCVLRYPIYSRIDNDADQTNAENQVRTYYATPRAGQCRDEWTTLPLGQAGSLILNHYDLSQDEYSKVVSQLETMFFVGFVDVKIKSGESKRFPICVFSVDGASLTICHNPAQLTSEPTSR